MKIYYEETQYLPKTIIAILVGFGLALTAFQFGVWFNNGWQNFLPKAGILVLLYLILWSIFMIFRQKTTITEQFIKIQYTPFQNRIIPLERIASMDLINHIGILGYGVRKTDNGWSYNISAKQGVFLKSIVNKKLIIGSLRNKELLAAITQALAHSNKAKAQA